MDLETYLDHHGLTFADLRRSVSDALGLDGDDVAYVTGSLVEGLGNRRSDLDVYVVSDRDLAAHQTGPVIAAMCGRQPLDIEWFRPADIDDLTRRLDAVHSHPFRLTPKEVEILHRLRVGRQLSADAARFRRLADAVRPETLAALLFGQAEQGLPGLQEDVAGAIEIEDVHTAAFVTRQMLAYAEQALLAVQLDTNPTPKWRWRKLHLLARGATAQSDAPSRGFAQALLSLHRRLGFDMASLVSAATGAVLVANAVILYGQLAGPWTDQDGTSPPNFPFLTREPQPPSVIDSDTSPLPMVALDLIVRRHGETFTLRRVHGGNELTVNHHAVDAMLFFDGATTVEAAARALAPYTEATLDDIQRAVVDLSTAFDGLGFLQAAEARDTRSAVASGSLTADA